MGVQTRFLALSLFVLLLGWPASTGAAEPAKKPNIVFLFSDDQRGDTIAALGNEHIRTPNLDLLVREGTAFRRTYCMGAMQGAVCVPSRAMLLTGRTLFRVRENLKDQATWPAAFAEDGYRTFITGKWHNGPESLTSTFQEGRAVFLGGMGDPYHLPIQDFGADHKLTGKRNTDKHSVEVFTDSAIDFIHKQKGDRPFLAYVAFNAPHDPRVAPKEYHERFKDNPPPLPANFLPVHPFNNGDLIGRDERLAPRPRTEKEVRRHLADYYASIEFLDAQVGRVVEALHKSGQYENTILVYSSDHGLAIGSHGLLGKQNLYDQSMNAPLILAGPGVPAGKTQEALTYLLDIFPTLGELAGVAAPSGSEGKSLVPVLQGKQTGVRDSLFTAFEKYQRAVRDDRWKLIVYPQINKTQLFDLKNDPGEMKDLVGEPTGAAEVKRLTALLQDWQKQLGDDQPLTVERPEAPDFDFSKVPPVKKE